MKLACMCGNGDFMKNEKTGVVWAERRISGKPFRLWNADLMACKTCPRKVLILADKPYIESFETGFQAEYDRQQSEGKLI